MGFSPLNGWNPWRSLAALAVLCIAATGAPAVAAELLCAPSPRGAVTTWLMTGPFKFLGPEDFDGDFLERGGGEAAVRPRAGELADPVSGLSWQAQVFPEAVVDLGERCLSVGQSAFYMFAMLVPRKSFSGTLRLTHTGWARVWLDGEKVVTSDYDPYSYGYRTAERRVRFKAGQRVACLVKVGSKSRRLQFVLAVHDATGAVGPKALAVALPREKDGAPAVEPHVFSALSVGLERGDSVRPGQEAQVALGVKGGYPECDGPVTAAIAIKNAKGLTAKTLSAPPKTLAALAREPVRLAWTPASEKATASYELIARVSYDGQELGALSKTVYAPSEIRQWTLDLLQRLERLEKTKDVSREALAHVLLKIEKADLLWKKRTTEGLAPEEIHRELRTASRWLEDIQEGKPVPGPLQPGVHEMAYLARQDDSAQPYYLHIPRTYTRETPAPAIVYLHGYAPDLDKTNWHMPSTALTDQAEKRGYVLIIPFARSNTDFQGIGETDVLRVLELANQKLNLDRERTLLVGYSMGGMGAYTIAAHRPHLWAGVVALCARADYYFWKGLDREKVAPWKRPLIEAEFGWPLAANFRHLPVLAYQGTSDMLIKPRQAYRFVDRLDRLGASARVVRLDGQDHWIADAVFSTPEAFDWMDARRLDAAPRTIRFKTYSLRHNRAYWATIDAFVSQGRPASVDLTLDDGGKLTLVSENVAQLTLRPPKELVPRGSFLHATVNGKGDRFRPEKGGEYVVRLAKVPNVKRRKRPGLCGPIKDAFNDRFILVYGAQGGEEAAERNRKRAESFRRDWYRFAKGMPRIIPDTRLTKTHIAAANLFLFGTPKTHAFLADIAGRLPIRFTEDGCRILHWTYPVNDSRGLMFISPNPEAPDRYVVVCAGAPYGRDLPVNHKYDLLPDFIVYGTEADYDDTNVTYAAGFFDNLWKLKESLLWRHDGTPRAKPAAAFEPAAPREAVPQ